METTEVNISKLIEVVAYGDAVGLPMETMTHSQIKERFGTIAGLNPVKENAFFAGEHETGSWSDDTQLSIAVAQGLVDRGGYDIRAQADRHLEQYSMTPLMDWQGKSIPRGWGGSTTRSMARMTEGFHPLQAGAISHDNQESGKGNGVVMKLGPMAAWSLFVDGDEIYEDAEDLTVMTHNTETALLTSLVHLDVLRGLGKADPDQDPLITVQEIIRKAIGVHKSEYPSAAEELTGKLKYIMDSIKDLSSADILEHTDGKGFYVPETLAMAYGSFVNESRFPECTYRAAELGGDTDSIASIVGTMSLFFYKDVELPEDADMLYFQAKDQRFRRSHLKKVGIDLADLVMTGRG